MPVALDADFLSWTTLPKVTGRVTEMFIVSESSDGEPWGLRTIEVSPLAFRRDLPDARAARREVGLMVLLEVLIPACRCEEIFNLTGAQASSYSLRHLVVQPSESGTRAETLACPKTGRKWELRREPQRDCNVVLTQVID